MGGTVALDVVYDTGSDWVVVEGIECRNCQGDKYDMNLSEGYPKKNAYTLSVRSYGSAKLEGYEYVDKVCLRADLCVDDFEYFLIEEQYGIAEPLDGIIGMARNHAFHIAPDAGNESGPLLIDALAENGKINSNTFSFYFQHPEEDSWMDLGEPDLSNLKEGIELVETQMIKEDFFWGFYGAGIAIGTIENSYRYEVVRGTDGTVFDENGDFYSIIDTGSTALVISVLYFESLIE